MPLSDNPLPEASCEDCGFEGWSQDGWSPHSKLSGTNLAIGGQSDSDFLKEILRFPFRTRLKQICETWGISARQHRSKLTRLNDHLEIWPYAFQLRTGNDFVGQSDIVSDELLSLDWLPSISKTGFSGQSDIMIEIPEELDVDMNRIRKI